MVKQRARAAIGPSGVIGDSARGKISGGTREARPVGGDGVNAFREHKTVRRPGRESEGSIVAMKRLIPVERRDPAGGVFS